MSEIELNCNIRCAPFIYWLAMLPFTSPMGLMGWQWLENWPHLSFSLSLNCWNKKIASRQRKHAKSLFFFFLLFIPSRSIDSQQINYFCVTLHKVKRQNKTPREMPGMVVVGGFSTETRRNAPVWKEHSFTGSPLESLARQTNREEEGNPCSSF